MDGVKIPSELSGMLRDFTVAVIKEQPEDVFDFAADYFQALRTARAKKLRMYQIVEDDEMCGEPEKHNFRPKTNRNQYARRQSVAAERYDPEDDDDDSTVVHPKTDAQRRRLEEAVQSILIVRSLDAEQKRRVIDAMFEVKVSEGQRVITQGDDGDNFYVIESGTFDVFVRANDDERLVYTFDNQGCFGELALLYNMPRSATVVTVREGTLWAMDRVSFRRIVLKSAFLKRKRYESLLQSVPMLEKLDPYERMNLADALTTRTFADGDVIIRQDDDADGMYFVGSGQVLVTVKQEGEEVPVPSCDVTYFGELALVENSPRTASVYAKGDVTAAYLERDSFERLLGPCIDIMKRNIEHYVVAS